MSNVAAPSLSIDDSNCLRKYLSVNRLHFILGRITNRREQCCGYHEWSMIELKGSKVVKLSLVIHLYC